MQRLRVLELFCGIGGCAAALNGTAEIVAAIDINRKSLTVYRENFSHPIEVRAIESLRSRTLSDWNADLWWLSPPCQPYTIRGRRRDIHDPRAASLLALLEKIPQIKPRHLALENVPGFYRSAAHARLRETLERCGYSVKEILLCPTQLGIPNRRRRYYCVASRDRLHDWPELLQPRSPLRWNDVLESLDSSDLDVSNEVITAYNGAVHVVAADDPQAISCCFTSSYGRSVAASGSYLRIQQRHRRFSPAEILRLLGFPSDYRFPATFTPLDSWPLLGNSLSIPAVRYALSCIPGLALQNFSFRESM
jgi:DNA (cytosine-5)-methyltransferase 1